MSISDEILEGSYIVAAYKYTDLLLFVVRLSDLRFQPDRSQSAKVSTQQNRVNSKGVRVHTKSTGVRDYTPEVCKNLSKPKKKHCYRGTFDNTFTSQYY